MEMIEVSNHTKTDRAIRIVTASNQSAAALTTAAMVFKPSDIKVESLDQKYRLSDGEDLILNNDIQLHILVGKEGERQCRSVEELNQKSSIVNIKNSIINRL